MSEILVFRSRQDTRIFRLTPYITQEAQLKLRQYKYAGGDAGILYRYFYNPVALKLVDMIPDTIAPNLLTLIGFLFTIVPFIMLFSLYGQSFEGEVPAWWCYFEAVSYLIYRMLDEMDGKQARKTGNSSPLGLLFDHGCDSFTTGLMTMMLMKLLQVGNSHMLIVGLVAITQSFHFSTLEEYYVGGLFLGVGNGVTDGSIVLIGVVTLCGVFGQSFWKEIFSITVFEETYFLRASHIFIYFMLFTQIIAVANNILTMVKHHYKDLTPEQREQGEVLKCGDLVSQVFAFYCIYTMIYIAIYAQDDAIIYWNPIVPCLIGVFLYVHITIHIQVAHVSKQKYNPWPRIMLSSFFIMVIYTVLCKYQRYEINQQYFFMGLLIFISICQWHFILNVIYEMTVTLNIRVFKVKPKNQLYQSQPLREEVVSSQIELQDIGRPDSDIENTDASSKFNSEKKNFNFK